MTLKPNILEGLHVLLVSEDEARVSSLAKALRDRKASVGDARTRSRESLALRGADLVVVDSRSSDATRSAVADMRSDVRARWASVTVIDFADIVLDGGAVVLGALESEVTPLVAADRDLTERARKEETFEVSLRPLGPSRMLRALAAAGPTMHLEIIDDTLTGVVDLSNELLVCAFAERGTSEKWEAWTALVRILGLLDARVKVSRRAHPTAMNIMEPIDQALEVAAQERRSSADLIAQEERTARARVAVDLATTGSHPATRSAGTLGNVTPARDEEMGVALAPPRARPSPQRTLLGVAAPRQPHAPAATSAPIPGARAPSPSRYPRRTDGGAETNRPADGRTLLGLSAGTLPVFGGMPRPVVNLSVPNFSKGPSDTPAQARPPRPANTQTRPRSGSQQALEEGPADRDALMRESARDVVTEAAYRPARPPAATIDEVSSVSFASVAANHVARSVDVAPSEPPAFALAAQSAPGESQTRDLLDVIADSHGDDRVPDLPDYVHAYEEDIADELVAASAGALQAPAAAAPAAHAPPAHAPAPAVREPGPVPMSELAPVHLVPTEVTPTPNLLAAIGEEVATAVFSDAPGARPIEPARGKKEPVQAAITRLVKKPRTLQLLILLLVVVAEYYAVTWSERRGEEVTEKARSEAAAGRTSVGGPHRSPQPVATPQAAPVRDVAPTAGQPAKPPVSAGAAQVAPTAPAAAVHAAPQPKKAEAAETAASDEDAKADTDTLVRTGMQLLEAGDAAGARRTFERAVSLDARDPHARGGLAEVLLTLGRPADALREIEQAITLRPRRARYRVTLGDALQALGKDSEARAAWRKALALEPDDRDARKRLDH